MTGDNNDDWFYDSIRSYKTLLMYELRINPLYMANIGNGRLCISGHNAPKDMCEIIAISMPEKLFLLENEANLSKNNDFEMESGQFYQSKVHMMKNLQENEKAVVSFKDTVGLSILDLHSANIGETNENHILQNQNLVCPNFATHDSEQEIIATKDASDKIIKMDLLADQETFYDMPQELTLSTSDIFCNYCDNNEIALINSKSGVAAIYDLRCPDYSIINNNELNNCNYVLGCDKYNQIAIFSSKGTIKIYDKRHKNKILIESEINIPYIDDDNNHLKINLTSANRLSISGFDNYVYIYDTSGSELCQIFKHCGHNEAEEINDTFVTDHFWLSQVSTNLVVSCAKNGTLNCWEYVV